MANPRISVDIIGDASSFKKELTSAVASTNKANSSFQRMGKAAGVAGLALGGVLVAGLASSVKAAADFDSAMRNVNSIAKLNETQFKSLSKEVNSMAGDVAQKPKVLAEGLYDIVSSGFAANDALKVLRASARAATAGMTDTATASKAVTASLNAYHLGANQARKVSDVLFQTVNKGVLTFDELSQNIGDVLPAASALSVPLQDVGAALATITLHGVNAAEASTQVKSLMISMLKPSVSLNAEFKKLGYESAQAALKQKGLVGVINDLSGAAGGNQKLIASWFPNIRALAGFMGLAGKNAGQFAQNVKAMDAASKGAGATTAVFAEQSKSLTFQWKQFSASIESTKVALGTALMPALQPVMSALKRLGDYLSEHPKLAQALAIGIGLAATALIGLSVAAIIAASGMSAFWIAATGGLILLVPALIIGITELIKHFDDLKGALQGFGDWVKRNWPIVVGILTGGLGFAGAEIVHHWGDIKNAFSDAMSSIRGAVSSGFHTVTSTVGNAMSSVRGAVSSAWATVTNTVRNAVGSVGSAAAAVGRSILNGLRSALATVGGVVENAMGRLRSALVSAAGDALRGAVAIGRAIVSGVLSGLGNLAGAVAGKIHAGISGAIHAAGGLLHGSGEYQFTRWAVGKPLVDGIVKGVEENGWKLASAVHGVVAQAAAGAVGSQVTIPVRLQIAETQAELTGDVARQIKALQDEAEFLARFAATLNPRSQAYLDVLNMLLGINNQIKSLTGSQNDAAAAASTTTATVVASTRAQAAANAQLVESQDTVTGSTQTIQQAVISLKNALGSARDQAGGLREQLLKLDGTKADTFLTQHVKTVFDGTSGNTELGQGGTGGPIPKLAHGGVLTKSGLVFAHAGETVTPAKAVGLRSGGGGGGTVVNVHVDGALLGSSVPEVAKTIRQAMLKEIRRAGGGADAYWGAS